MNFSEALNAVKNGKKAKRAGWNGKDQFIELATNVSFIRPNGEVVNVNHKDMGNKAIAFHGTSGIQLGWLASQSDMLSEDWLVVEWRVKRNKLFNQLKERIKMTIKEFKDLLSDLEKNGEINTDSEIFVLDEDEGVMSEPALFTDNDRDLILKYSYQNEVLIQD